MLKKLIYFVLLLSIQVSCNNRSDITPITGTVDVKDLKMRALNNGDTTAYYQLSLDFMDSPYEGFLYTALIMANKHNYHQAHADVYYCLTDYFHKKSGLELKDLDEITKKMALSYLKKGALLGNKNCITILETYKE